MIINRLRTFAFKPRAVVFALLRMFFAMYAVTFVIQGYLIFPAYLANSTLGKLKTPLEYGITDFSEIHLSAADGTRLMGWTHPAQGHMPVILYLHGNAMHLAARIPRFREFTKEGYGLFALSYRGYGKSEGSPSEKGLYEDARAAIAWINHNYQNPKIIIYGESLGTGVAVEMATEYPVYGIVIQSGYTSIADVAAETYWFLPGTHSLVLYPFDSLSKIARVHCPILILHGDRDSQIPFEHGKKLFEKANEPKRFILVPGAGHTNIPDTVIMKAMHDFFIVPLRLSAGSQSAGFMRFSFYLYARQRNFLET